MRLVYDIEADGLQDEVTTVWMIVAYNIDNKQMYCFSDHGNLQGSIKDGVRFLENADLLIGHNVIGYDSCVLDKLP